MLKHELFATLVKHEVEAPNVESYEQLAYYANQVQQSSAYLESMLHEGSNELNDAHCFVSLGSWDLHGDTDQTEAVFALLSRVCPAVQLIFHKDVEHPKLAWMRHLGVQRSGGMTLQLYQPLQGSEAERAARLRALLPPGSELTLALGLTEDGPSLQAISELRAYCSTVIFDSAQHYFDSGLVNMFPVETLLVDVQWMRLVFWREAIKQTFALPELLPPAGAIRSIEFSHEDSIAQVRSSARHTHIGQLPLLLPGWLLESLGWKPRAFFKQGFECASSDGSIRQLGYQRGGPRGMSLSFSLESGRKVSFSEDSERGIVATLDGSAEEERIFLNTELSTLEALERYFMIGESVINYRRSRELGAELLRLASAY